MNNKPPEQLLNKRFQVNESEICTMEAKWWALNGVLKVYDDDELPDKMYDKLFDEKWELEKSIAGATPQTAEEVISILNLAKKTFEDIWGPPHGQEPCPTGQNVSNSLQNVIDAMKGATIQHPLNELGISEERELLQRAVKANHALHALYESFETTSYEADSEFLVAKGELNTVIHMLSGGCMTTEGLQIARDIVETQEALLKEDRHGQQDSDGEAT